MKVNFATAQWQIGAAAHADDFFNRVDREISEVCAQGAQVVLLPEYLFMELAYSFGEEVRGDLQKSLQAVDGLYALWLAQFGEIARRHAVYIGAGSFLRKQANGKYRNRAILFDPRGAHVWQEKLRLTGFEKHAGSIETGDALKVFDTDFGRLGINICYDIEFPLFARAQAEAGAAMILVPSCTDTQAGAARVRIGCQARALENQLPVIRSVTAGRSDWCAALDINSGDAAIYVQPDRGLPDDGVLARLDRDSGWLVSEVDIGEVRAKRKVGQVGVSADWDGQLMSAVRRAQVQRFSDTVD